MKDEEKKLLRRALENMKKATKIMQEDNNLKEKKINETEIVFQRLEIKEWGNSAHIPISKKYVGHCAEVRILKKEEDK